VKYKSIIVGAALIAGFVISGCANNRELMAKSSLSTRNDVFFETSISETGSGKAIADFMFTVKSNSSRFAEIYIKHSNPPYRVYMNIDGQTTVLESEPILENKSPVDSSLPESGTGWKYEFSKRIALAPGKHKLTIVLPIDDVIVEREIALRAGVNTITVIPVYNKRSLQPYKGHNFTAGVKTLKVMVN
jgi:hypothetical protein